MPLKARGNRHIKFDEDEDTENLPILEPLSKGTNDETPEKEDAESSDSDGAPEEATITAGKEEAQKEEDTVKSEIVRRKQQMKEKRKQQHEKNKLQQEEKRKRLEEQRLPESLLDAVATERKTRSAQREAGAPAKKKKRKIKTVSDSDGEAVGGLVEHVDEESLITIDTGVKVRTLEKETKKTNEIMRRAADFRQQALYGGKIRRMPSKQLQEMEAKRMKSGKAVFGGVKG